MSTVGHGFRRPTDKSAGLPGYHACLMRRFIYQLVDRLADTDSGLSRNRHFALFATPSGARALQLHRRLSGLRNELAQHGDSALLSVAPHEAGVEIRLEIPPLKLVRTSLLSADDVAVLLRHAGPLPEALRHLLHENPALHGFLEPIAGDRPAGNALDARSTAPGKQSHSTARLPKP